MNFSKMAFRFILALAVMAVSISCMNSENSTTEGNGIRYLPLGDSYSIGSGSSQGHSFPELLAKHMVDSGYNFYLVGNPARNGYTCKDLIAYELPVFFQQKPDFVTLCIGTNDWNVGYDSSEFHHNLRFILDTIQGTLKVKTNIVLLTVPDFGLTQGAAIYANGRNISAGLATFNEIIKQEAAVRGLKCVDIFAVSQEVKNDPTLISGDNIHPSDKGYAEWEKAIFPVVRSLIKP